MTATPWPLFSTWLDEATSTEPRVPESMQIATVDATGMPSLRTVLLKAHGADGLVFYTNFGSRKAVELDANPRIAFLLHYKGLERQVRGEGRAERVDDITADAYFASRPRGSQIGAWASQQSTEIGSRAELERAVAGVEARFAGQDVPRPPFWGGYRIVPERIEFWQGREDRLHERDVWLREAQGWRRVRLSP